MRRTNSGANKPINQNLSQWRIYWHTNSFQGTERRVVPIPSQTALLANFFNRRSILYSILVSKRIRKTKKAKFTSFQPQTSPKNRSIAGVPSSSSHDFYYKHNDRQRRGCHSKSAHVCAEYYTNHAKRGCVCAAKLDWPRATFVEGGTRPKTFLSASEYLNWRAWSWLAIRRINRTNFQGHCRVWCPKIITRQLAHSPISFYFAFRLPSCAYVLYSKANFSAFDQIPPFVVGLL